MGKPSKATAMLAAGTGINLTIGFLYAWSVFKKAIVADWGWTHSQANAPYTVAIAMWAVALLVAGVVQDRIGPRRVIQIGVFLVGSGIAASAFFATPLALIITVGVVVATGIGFTYGCVTPMAMKWFHPGRKGLVSGITVGGFGIAAVYYAPLAGSLIRAMGVSHSFLAIGLGILAIGLPLSFYVNNPPAGYVPAQPTRVKAGRPKLNSHDYTWRQMLRTPSFYILWIMFVLSSSAGVMMIGHLASIASLQTGMANTALVVSLLAVSNASGRIGGGMLSDRIGRRATMILVFSTQLANMLLFPLYTTYILIALGTIVAGFSYGSLMSTFPSITSDNWGMKSYGANYGVLYTAWGVSGVLGPLIAGYVVDSTGGYGPAFLVSAALLAVAIALGLILKPVNHAPGQKA